MRIDQDGNMELTAAENQDLMDRLDIPESQYDQPPVEIECTGMDGRLVTFTATNTETGKSITLVFERIQDDG
ncbi:hypothetical protein [Candidatus Methylocalor cossyra]|uniref:Heat shock 70 kDa protein 12A n=1 Tax=Candidatus Methylocalor cossyra TaxID=3108543 RepID=A0ABP1CBJ8_9GAMM